MKKRKMNFVMLSDLVGGYVDFKRVSRLGVMGYAYRLERKLTEDERKTILSYQNTSIGTWQHLYAPEMSMDGVFLGDKCFTSK